MRILSLKINNILSIEEAEISFNESGLMLIKGWDYDSGRANGAGKTAIFNALSFALYDKLPRKITASEIIRRGCKTGNVEVEIEVRGSRYSVKRSRPKGVSFLCGGEPIAITQQEFESKIGLNYNQFTMIAYCSQGASNRFLSVNDSDKKKFLLQLLDLDTFANAKKIADEFIKQISSNMDAEYNIYNSNASKKEAYSELLLDQQDIEENIHLIDKNLQTLNSSLIELSNVNKPDLTKFQSLEEDISNKILDISRKKIKRDFLYDQYKKIQNQIKPFF